MGWKTAVLAGEREISVALSRSILDKRSRTSAGVASEARKESACRIQNLFKVGQTKSARKHQEVMTAAPQSPACMGFPLGRSDAKRIPSSVQTATMTRIRIHAPDLR